MDTVIGGYRIPVYQIQVVPVDSTASVVKWAISFTRNWGAAANAINNLHGDQYYLFSNILTVACYWATPLSSGDPTRTWAFRFDLGYQGAEVIEGRTFWVWPVRSGDVASGDINGDGDLDAADVLLAIRVALGDLAPTAEQLIRGDIAPMVDGAPVPNGVINTADLVAIISRALKM